MNDIHASPRTWCVLWSLSALLAACGGGGGGGGGEDPIAALAVTAVEPADAASAVARDARAILTFSAPVAPASVGTGSIVLESVAGTQAPAASAVGNRVTLTPASRLLPLTEHVIRVTPQVVGERGERPPSDILRRFTTADGRWREVQTVGTAETLLQAPTLAMDREGNALAAWTVMDQATPDFHRTMRVSRYDAATGTWSDPATLSAGIGDTQVAQLVMDDAGNGMLIWQHLPGPTSGQPLVPAIWAARFDRVSGLWGQPGKVSSSTGDAFWPAVAVRSNGDVAVAWAERSLGGDDTVWWATSSTAPEAGWSQPRRADDPDQPGSFLTSDGIRIALSPTGARMALAWASSPRTGPGVPSSVVWARMLDETPAGQLKARIVSNNDGDSQGTPGLAIDRSGVVHVAWQQVQPSTSGGARSLWTVRHDATGWRTSVRRSAPQDRVEVHHLATNRAAAGVDATWLAWVQAPTASAPSQLRALKLGPDEAGSPDSLASGEADALAHKIGLAVDPRGNALAVWLQSALQGDHVRTVRYGALPGTWSAPQPFGSDMGFIATSAEGLSVNAVGDILLGWRGIARDDGGVITHRPLRTRRFE